MEIFKANERYHVILTVMLLMLLCACGSRQTDSSRAHTEEEDSYHADNDIAMTLRSLTDALKVGETLDSLDYDFEGILTDGQGHTLYTDIQGNPGEWMVEVTDDSAVVIRNLYLGDLLPDDLRSYLLEDLNLTDADLTCSEDDDNMQLFVYDLDGAYLKFEIRSAMASNGLEGPLMRIVASRDEPM